MKLTKLELESLRMALEYSICDYESNLQFFIDNRELYNTDDDTEVNKSVNETDIKIARRELKGMQRVQQKLLQEIK